MSINNGIHVSRIPLQLFICRYAWIKSNFKKNFLVARVGKINVIRLPLLLVAELQWYSLFQGLFKTTPYFCSNLSTSLFADVTEAEAAKFNF